MKTKCLTHKSNATTKGDHFRVGIATLVSRDHMECYKPVYVRSENKLVG